MMLALLSDWFSAAPGFTVLGVLTLPSLLVLLLFGRASRVPADEAALETTELEADLSLDGRTSPEPLPRVQHPILDDLDQEVEDFEAPFASEVGLGAGELEMGLPPTAPAPSLATRLARTSEAFVGRIGSLLSGRKLDAEVLEDLEALLFSADLGVGTADALLDAVRSRADGGDADAVRAVLREEVEARVMRVSSEPRGLAVAASPHVILVLGVNGSGKTTTIGKLAARYARVGKRVVLGAGDTFRAAAIEQLGVWAERVDCDIVKGQPGGDPASVAFDTVKAAVAREADVAIIDTAGRLQTEEPLIEELRKIVRVIGRECENAPHETLLVLDANTGQNAISQARVFTEAAGVTGIVLTKLDGTAKGGVLVGLSDEFGIPVRFVGVGEGIDDLRDFDPEEFVDALFHS